MRIKWRNLCKNLEQYLANINSSEKSLFLLTSFLFLALCLFKQALYDIVLHAPVCRFFASPKHYMLLDNKDHFLRKPKTVRGYKFLTHHICDIIQLDLEKYKFCLILMAPYLLLSDNVNE